MRSSTRKDAAPLAQKWLKEIASRSQSFAEVEKWKWKRSGKNDPLGASGLPELLTLPLTSPQTAHSAQKITTPPGVDGNAIARTGASPAHKLRPPTAPGRVLFGIPDKLTESVPLAFCCCKLQMFLYIEGYKGRVQSKFGAQHTSELAVCCARFSGNSALPAGAL
jgi:hypothetical protein